MTAMLVPPARIAERPERLMTRPPRVAAAAATRGNPILTIKESIMRRRIVCLRCVGAVNRARTFLVPVSRSNEGAASADTVLARSM
jgi:hypothetical protein